MSFETNSKSSIKYVVLLSALYRQYTTHRLANEWCGGGGEGNRHSKLLMKNTPAKWEVDRIRGHTDYIHLWHVRQTP